MWLSSTFSEYLYFPVVWSPSPLNSVFVCDLMMCRSEGATFHCFLAYFKTCRYNRDLVTGSGSAGSNMKMCCESSKCTNTENWHFSDVDDMNNIYIFIYFDFFCQATVNRLCTVSPSSNSPPVFGPGLASSRVSTQVAKPSWADPLRFWSKQSVGPLSSMANV